MSPDTSTTHFAPGTPSAGPLGSADEGAPIGREVDAGRAALDPIAVRGFLLAHAVMVNVLVVILLGNDGTSGWPAIPPAIATIAVWVWAARRERRTGEVREAVWLVFAALWLTMVAVDPLFLQALFTLFPVSYALVRWPLSVLASALLPAVWGLIEFRAGEPAWEWALIPMGTWILSCCLGYWVFRVIEQSEERAALIAELEATRTELAIAQRAEGARAERDRMARDIHDTLAQGFSSIVLHARGALARDDARQARQTLELVERVAAEHLGEARRLVAAGGDGTLGEHSLVDAIDRVAGADVPMAHVHVDGDGRRLSGAIEIAVLRITQEAVANARKHADASRIDITLSYTDRGLLLDVVDDGRGFEVEAVEQPSSADAGYGIAGIRRRVEELGGSVTIESTPGAGTALSVAFPTETA